MATQIFRYTIHRVSVKKALKRGEIRKKNLEQAVKAIQRKIKKIVIKQHVPLYLRVWNADDTTERFKKQYDNRRDFRTFKKPSKWRKKLSRRAKYSRTFDPSATTWFVAIKKRGKKRPPIIALTKLSGEPKKKTLLGRKRKRLFGPFETEERAREFIMELEKKLTQETTEFSQRRRYSGPMEEGNGQ